MGELDEIERIGSGDIPDGEERNKVLSCFNDPDKEFLVKNALYQRLENINPEVQNGLSIEKLNKLWQKIEAKSHAKSGSFKLQMLYWGAAILILGFFIGNFYRASDQKNGNDTFCTAVAPKGSVSEITLPDSTHIFLNSGSRIRYASSEKNNLREVYLEGEAWFKVKKSAITPFVVHTGTYDVRVMGTEFNVKTYDEENEVVTTLEQGSIQIESGGKFKLEKNIRLVPGEQLVLNKATKSLTLSHVKPENYSAWRDNSLVFNNIEVKDLIVLLERRYDVDIDIIDQEILAYHYDGVIRSESIFKVLDILEKTLPIKYVIKDQKIKILKRLNN